MFFVSGLDILLCYIFQRMTWFVDLLEKLALPLYLEFENLITTVSSFSQVVNHMRANQKKCIEAYGGGDKRLFHQYNAIGIPCRSEDPFEKVKFTYCRLVQIM